MSVVQRILYKTSRGDQIAMSVFLFGGMFLLWYELCHVSSYYYPDWTLAYTAQLLLALFFAANIYGNWVMMIVKDTTGRDIVFPQGPAPPGWHYCDVCVANRPPRSYHCPLCNLCVLRRDHHCWFAGCCVGHGNHRYFLALCVHMVVAGLYCNLYNWDYVWSVKGPVSFTTLLSFIIPHVTALMGRENWQTFYVSTLSMLGFCLTLIFSWLLQIQGAQLLRGQTRFERKKGVVSYDQGLWSNLRALLGHRMFLTLLCPLLPSSVPGDGVRFYSQSQKEI